MRRATRFAIGALLFCAVAACSMVTGTLLAFFHSEAPVNFSQRALTFADRVAYQRAIEEVYWRHRIWPNENSKPKPSLDEVMSAQQIERKVEDYLSDSQALEAYWQKPITPEQLQAEMDRMAKHTKQPEVLRELFESLGNDPSVIAECLARPVLAERLVADLSAHDKGERFALIRTQAAADSKYSITTLGKATYALPEIAPCTDDTWTATSTTNAPSARSHHTAVWTGSEMIVWGGYDGTNYVNTGGRYNPSTDSWTATSTTNAPNPRFAHTVVWTGSEMIVWGGVSDVGLLNTGGRYNPGSNSWVATNTTNAPDPRFGHSAVWTGSEMIVWGGEDGFNSFNTGGRYNPGTDSWAATNTTNGPAGRESHTAIWTGDEMIVWGGADINIVFDTGGRYNPGTNSWTVISTTNAPAGRESHTAVWTGDEMIVWGGSGTSGLLNTGGRYNPGTDSWTPTSTTNLVAARDFHTAVWSGSEMIIWGGGNGGGNLNTGGRYCAGTPSPTPTPTPTGCSVSSSQPPCGSIVAGTAPTDFTVNLSDPADPVTVQESDFTVNGTPANTAILLNGNTTITFHFNTSPVIQGQNTMHIPAGAFNCGQGPVQEFTCTFTYEPTPTPTPTPRPSPTPRARPTPAPRP